MDQRGLAAELGAGADFGPPADILTCTLSERAEAAQLETLDDESMPSRIAVAALLVVLACSRTERHDSATRATSPKPRSAAKLSSVEASAPSQRTAAVKNVPAGDEPMVIGGDVTAPIVIERVEPEWPEVVTRQAVWLFSAVVTKDGRIRDLELTMGPPGLHSRAAEKAIRQWRFKPGTLHGRPVDVKYNLSVRIHVR